ncbi:hypothetical protein AOQ84DRAFT_92228 [Glonium stellatum]|uniref:Uncharacterized protein n=1 Tax=Glonium stellatum TaxID=574774 RepID=A0A8E2JXV0_9PEZI|nr:hypothetical protein AOQ84DRAFT_92228 [Glonium stellatum]
MSATATGPRQTHSIAVGQLENRFSPDNLNASVGDVVKFSFFPSNHSVARAEYLIPCIPYEDTGTGKVGFFSGFVPVNPYDFDSQNPPYWLLTVNNSDPMFFYDSSGNECINFTMVGVINPRNGGEIYTQKEAAANSTLVLSPGEIVPPGVTIASVPASISTAQTSGSMRAASSTSATTSASSTISTGSSTDLSGGAIAGVVIGAIALAIIAIGVLIPVRRRMRSGKSPYSFSGLSFKDRANADGTTYPSTVYAPDVHNHPSVSPGTVPLPAGTGANQPNNPGYVIHTIER